MNGLNTHIYDEKTKNIESNNNFDIEENKLASEEEKNEFRNKLEEEKAIQKEKQENQSKKLINQLNETEENGSMFLNKIKNNNKGKIFLEKIKEKQFEYKKQSNIEKYKDILPNMSRLNMPIIIQEDTNGNLLQNIDNNFLKELDKTIGSFTKEQIEEIKDLIGVIIVTGTSSLNLDSDCSMKISSQLNATKEKKIKSVFLHEFTHLKHNLISYIDNSFEGKLGNINSRGIQNHKTHTMYGGRPLRADSLSTLKVKEEGGRVFTDYVLSNGDVFRDQYVPEYQGYYLSKGNEEKITGNLYEILYENGMFYPKDGFMSPYSALKNDKSNKIFNDLINEGVDCKVTYQEELTTLIEEYYSNKEYFLKIIFNTQDGKKITLDEKYDKKSQYPLLREKLRLMIEYGFFPKGEFDQYFEK